MRIIILGAGTAIPARGYSPAGVYVEAGRERWLLDAGPGTVQRLHAAGVPWEQLDRVFLTHFHLDHCLDVATLLFALRIPSVARRKPLTVYGPRGLKRLYRRLNAALHGWLAPRGFALTLKELGETTLHLPGGTVQTKRMNHYATGALGYRLAAGGKTVAYSGDTDVCDEVIALGRQAHALILECAMTDERKVEGHLTPSECGRLAAEAGCRQLVLTHFYPVFRNYDIRGRVRRHFGGRLLLAKDLTPIRL